MFYCGGGFGRHTRFPEHMHDGKKQKHASQAPTVPEPSAGGPRHLGKIPCNPQKKTVMCNRALFLKLGLVKPLSIRML